MKTIDLLNIKEFSTRKEWETAAWHKLVNSLTGLEPRKLREVLELITSSHERRLMIRRVAAISRLQDGVSYREIGRELWLSPQTISLIKKAIAGRGYVSNWENAKALKRARELALFRKRSERPYPKQYRRTKYGRISIN